MLHFHIITFFIPVMSQVYSLFVVLAYLKKKKKEKKKEKAICSEALERR